MELPIPGPFLWSRVTEQGEAEVLLKEVPGSGSLAFHDVFWEA